VISLFSIKLAVHKTTYTAAILNSNKDSENNTGNQKYHPQYTNILFPSTKIIIKINSKITRAPIPWIMAHKETQKTIDNACKP